MNPKSVCYSQSVKLTSTLFCKLARLFTQQDLPPFHPANYRPIRPADSQVIAYRWKWRRAGEWCCLSTTGESFWVQGVDCCAKLGPLTLTSLTVRFQHLKSYTLHSCHTFCMWSELKSQYDLITTRYICCTAIRVTEEIPLLPQACSKTAWCPYRTNCYHYTHTDVENFSISNDKT